MTSPTIHLHAECPDCSLTLLLLHEHQIFVTVVDTTDDAAALGILDRLGYRDETAALPIAQPEHIHWGGYDAAQLRTNAERLGRYQNQP